MGTVTIFVADTSFFRLATVSPHRYRCKKRPSPFDILQSVDIDPIGGVENLTWASNPFTGMHTTAPLRAVVTDLRALGPNPTYRQVVTVLSKHGGEAQGRSLYAGQ